jgi:hypothetical protein
MYTGGICQINLVNKNIQSCRTGILDPIPTDDDEAEKEYTKCE